MSNDTHFRPVRGPEERILEAPISEGYLYFATDTGRIYLDKDGERIPMGRNSGIFYGHKVHDEAPDSGQVEFVFSIYDLDGNDGDSTILTIPNVDDLILNVPDGGFYRVMSVEGENINTERLTVAGTGGGGGGGGGGTDVPTTGTLVFDRITPSNITVLYGSDFSLGFTVTATDPSGEPTGNGRYVLYVNNVQKETGTVIQGNNYLNIDDYLILGTNTVKVIVYMDIGGAEDTSRSKTWTINTTNMELTWDYDETEANNIAEPFTFSWTVSGANIQKTTHIVINDNYELEKTSTTAALQTYTINPSEFFQHGAQKIRMYVSAELDGQEVITSSITKNMIFYDVNNSSPIISCGLREVDLQQYDTVQIPIVIYSPGNVLGDETVTLKEEGIVVDTWHNCSNSTQYYWAYTPAQSGIRVLSIQCGSSELTLTVNVVPLDIDIEEVGNYAFKFKANEFASNSAIQNWNSNGVTATFSDNFDWENGGLQTEYLPNGTTRQSLVVKAGTTMTVNYNLFEVPAQEKGKTFKIIYKANNCYDYDAQILNCKNVKYVVGLGTNIDIDIPTGTIVTYSSIAVLDENNNVILHNGQNIVYDLSNEATKNSLLHAYVEYEGIVYYCANIDNDNNITWRQTMAEDTGVGLLMTAQTGYLRSISTNTSIPYCEDSYMEFEFDIWPQGKGANFIQGWLDGVPCSVAIYASGNDFNQSELQPIVIGSKDCDVTVYLIKAYETHLSDEGHLSNFIADAPNAQEMLSRYKRNDILDERGEISPEKLAIANPKCTVHLYDVDRMTLTKKDKVLMHEYTQYLGSDQANLHATNAIYKVQGTSSAAYVLAAANQDINFKPKAKDYKGIGYEGLKPTFVDKDGNDLLAQGGWSMDEKAIPVTYFCVKVNVASCEGANNALNQEWYNEFQPYMSSVRRKTRDDGKEYRDTMQFKPGVIFIKDRNQTVGSDKNTENNVFSDTIGYINNPYYKMYSVGSMGNSKDNVEVFHDVDNPIECCIENNDNQLPGQWMVVPQGGYYDAANGDKFVAVDIVDIDDVYAEKDKTILCDDGVERTVWDLWYTGMDEVYGFRYPDGIEDAFDANEETAIQMTNAWYKFVNWVARNNPSPKYEAVEIKDEATFNKNKDNLYVVNRDSAGNVISHSLADTYTPDAEYCVLTVHVYGYTEEPLPEPVTFGAYTFSDSEYTTTLAGTTVTTYAGTYTHDTYKYRMAKMLSECEDHFVMDSVVYHYLFIERHTAIDNVAKNTFWSSSDCQHWDLTKDYDNDTADGNDNQGKLTLTYGYEVGDLRQGTSVFNAPNSVWLNFIKGLYTARQSMYQKLEGRGTWDDKSYLELFEEWQNVVPERCWIEDYYRKYLRPYIVYSDSMFLGMLEGGQKKHQRKQYETYQGVYIDSEYFGNKTKASYIAMRGNKTDGVDLTTLNIPVKMYSDCYLWGAFGSGIDSPNISKRTKRNDIVYISSPIKDPTDMTAYLFPAASFQEIGSEKVGEDGLERFGLKQFTVSSAPKLSKIVLGTYEANINNTLLEEVGFEGNPLLRELYICGYNAPKTLELNLGQATGLQVLDARNSSMFSSIVVANGAPLRTLKLEQPTGLKLYNLKQLQDFSITSYTKLNTIDLDNIDNEFGEHSKTIAQNVITLKQAGNAGAIDTYGLKNIKWTLTGQNEIEGTSGPIELVDEILTLNKPITGYHKTSLTGNILLNQGDLYDSNKQYEIYSKYAIDKQLSKLNIDFNPGSLKNIEIFDGNNNVLWAKKIISGQDITEEFLSSGPNGAFTVDQIVRANSQQYVFMFNNRWQVYDLDNLEAGYTELDASLNGGLPLYNNVQQNLRFVPIFEQTVRQYTLVFYDYDGSIIESKTVDYGTPRDEFLPMQIPYRDDSALPLTSTYSFEGYALMKTSTTPISSEYYVQNDQSFYPLFKQVSVYDNIHPEYFFAGNTSYIDPWDSKFSLDGVTLGLQRYIKGKITIPSTFEVDGVKKPVVRIGASFRTYQGDDITDGGAFGMYLTHVFFAKDTRVREFLPYAFAGAELDDIGINYIEYPDSLRCIQNNCFRKTPLKYYDIGSPTGNLYYIAPQAYQAAFVGNKDGNTLDEINIASSVVRIDGTAFRVLLGTNAGQIGTINIGSAAVPSKIMFSTSQPSNLFTGNDRNYIFHQNPDASIGMINVYMTETSKADLEAAGGIEKYVDFATIPNCSVLP